MKKLSLVLILGLLVSLLGFQSCTKEDDQAMAMQAPNLPTESMLAMDFNGFENVNPDERSFSNWFHAAVNVYFWTRTVYEIVHVPIVALQVAIHQDPVYQGDNTWLWSYAFTDENGSFEIEFYGTLTANDEVTWAMYVSKEGDFSDFLWFTGATAYDESYSNWILNKFTEDPADPFAAEEFLKIEYQYNMLDETKQIRYTNIIPEHPGNGGYIQYGNMVNEDYPVFYDIYKIEENNYTLINYNPQTKEGRVKDQKRFHDNEWHCWDANTNDIECQ